MTFLIVGNWKSNPTTLKKAKSLFVSLNKGIRKDKKVKVVICSPFIYFDKYSNFEMGAQNCFWEKEGSFTGEISASMLKDLGYRYVIIGHSERRKFLKETDEMINKKIKICLEENLTPILCISKISQINKALNGVLNKNRVIIAYEPLFAIGTGTACGFNKAKKINLEIKRILSENQIILYGGSVNYKNVADFIKISDFQGVLVGSESLNPKSFIRIVDNVRNLL